MTAANRFSLNFKRFMRLFAVIFSITALLCVSAIASYAASDDMTSGDLDIEITFDKENYSEGDSVNIMLSITNNTGKKIENVSARYYIPDCFEVIGESVTDIGVLNSRQTVRSQIQAVAKSDVGSVSAEETAEKDNTVLYIVLIAVSAVVFILSVAFLVVRERNRRKIAATISFVFAMIFCLSAFSTALMPVSADTSEIIFADDITYESAKAVISRLFPESYKKINPLLSSGNSLTRESAAVISAIMILGDKTLPEISEDPYIDVPADSASAPYILLSDESGVMPSISASRFDPSTSVSGYEFVQYVLRAAGFGARGEYKGQNARARVISDALSLPYTDASELLTESSISCSKALCFAISVMLNPSAEADENGNYTFTKASLISLFDGVTEKKALAANRNALVSENGERLDVLTKPLENKAYTMTYLNGAPLTLIKDFSTLGYNLVSIYSGKDSRDLGVGIEYTSPAPKNEYAIYKGIMSQDEATGARVFTADNVHYTVSEKAFENASYMLDAKIVDKSKIDYEKLVIFIAKVEKEAAIKNISRIICVYQLSSNESANYDAFNTALAAARAITNDKNTFLPSAYEKFVATVNGIDASLPRDLTDTEESRLIIAQAEADINEAVNALDKYLIESYEELDKEIARAEAELAKEGEYTEDSYNALKKAVDEAKALSRELLLGDTSKALIKESKDAVSKAIDSLKYSSYCNYAAYNQTLEIARKISNASGKYNATEFSNFQKNVNNIDSGLDKNLPKTEANQKMVDNARAAIQDAIERLNSKLPCEYGALDSAVSQAEALVKNDPENKTHKWKGGAFSAFSTALSDAKKVKRNMTLGYGSTNQQTIDAAATALFNAISALKENENDKFNMAEFDAAYKEASEMENTNGAYTEKSFALYKATLEKISAKIKDYGTLYVCQESTDIVNKALADIKAAKEKMNVPENCKYENLDAKLAEVALVDRSLYTPRSLAILDKAVSDANSVEREMLNDIYGDNQKIIDDAVKAIDDAVKALVEIKYMVTEVLSEVEKKETAGEDGAVIEQYLIKVLVDGKEKEFVLDSSVTERPAVGDVIVISYGADDILSIEIAKVGVGDFTSESTLKEIIRNISSYKAAEPNVGDKVVFFRNSADEILFITSTTEKLAEIVYSDSKLLVAGKETPIAEVSDFSVFTEKTLVKIVFAGRYAYLAEALTSTDATVSVNENKALYKESAKGEEKLLEASASLFEADETSTLLTLEKLISALKAQGAANAYGARLYLDSDGKLIACTLGEAVADTPAPDQGSTDNPQ